MEGCASTTDPYCDKCGKQYSSISNLNKHKKICGTKTDIKCSFCKKPYKTQGYKDNHEKSCKEKPLVLKEFHCNICQESFPSSFQLMKHIQDVHGGKRKNEDEPCPGPSKQKQPEICCRKCKQYFSDRHSLYLHHMLRHHHLNGEGSNILQKRPWNEGEEPWIEEDGSINDEFKNIYEANAPFILKPHTPGDTVETLNIPINNMMNIDEIMKHIQALYENQHHAFRINLMIGLFLRHVETGALRYFIPDDNQMLFDQPLRISNAADVKKLKLKLKNTELSEFILHQRPDSKWRPYYVTNIKIVVYKSRFRLGCPGIELPGYIRNNRNIVSLVNDLHVKQFNDNLCAFRCLTTFRQESSEKIKTYFHQWTDFMLENFNLPQPVIEEFKGLDMNDISKFEECFKININVYILNEDSSASCCYRSLASFSETMYCNLYEQHLSLITNINGYSKSFKCNICNMTFSSNWTMLRHKKTCSEKTKFSFPGGYYTSPKTVFDKLLEYGYVVPQKDQFFPWFIVFDFESMLVPLNVSQGISLKWTAQHVPISVSVCSNINGFNTPKCFIDKDIDSLVKTMVQYMESIADHLKPLVESKFSEAFDFLKQKMAFWKDTDKTMFDALASIKGSLYHYCRQLPVLGFNSAKYDLNLIKKYIAKHLNMADPDIGGITIKKNNSYTCISNCKLKFLDISFYLAPGTSYDKFLKAYGISQQKGFFPYEYLDSFDRLNETQLPPHEAFFSHLKHSNITPEEYSICQEVWNKNQMQTLKDFLIWYNNLDVEPMVQAIEKLQQFYKDKKIDLFKTSMSVPGIARQLLFRTGQENGATFALFGEKDQDLFHTIKDNIVGGPSIIFNRKAIAGETFIRNNPLKPCQRVLGFDANALYLWSIGQAMPTGSYIRRQKDKNFVPEFRDRYMMAYYWMDWLSKSMGINILHKINYGREKRVGPYPVDGYCAQINTIFQYHGCYWHGHECFLTKKMDRKQKNERQEKTKKTTDYLKKQGFTVDEMYECQFQKMIKSDQILKDFINSYRPMFFRQNSGAVTEKDILGGVLKGTLFGMIECDIEVPEQWGKLFQSSLSPNEYFEEMSPIFCTTDIPFSAIGKHMQEHVLKHDMSTSPRRLLVGGMKAKKILLASPLLQWYLRHGLEVTNIYQVTEYCSSRCFKDFMDDVTNARREGDANPNLSVIADTNKLIGNSGYGSLIMDKSKHRKITYVTGKLAAVKAINRKEFRHMTELNTEFFEVESAKNLISFDLPIQLGFFILQYAKLRMLEFYYDFMDVFVDRSDFVYCEMDTDSAYMAISGKKLQDVLKPERKNEYLQAVYDNCHVDEVTAKTHWFPRECCSRHVAFDKRTPGLFKLEYDGTEIISLCSKTYIVKNGNEVKCSAKGVQRRAMVEPYDFYKSVLETGEVKSVVNKGFRVKDNEICTYEQEKCGFNYFYCKRLVLDNGIDTKPLEITLNPKKKDSLDLKLIDILMELSS